MGKCKSVADATAGQWLIPIALSGSDAWTRMVPNRKSGGISLLVWTCTKNSLSLNLKWLCSDGKFRTVSLWPFSHSVSFLQRVLVHTAETTRLRYFTQLLLGRGQPLMLVGHAGVGKTVFVRDTLASLSDDYVVSCVPFNYYTTSAALQSKCCSCLPSGDRRSASVALARCSAGWSIVLMRQGCVFDPWSGHVQESVNECINKWINKSLSLSQIIVF